MISPASGPLLYLESLAASRTGRDEDLAQLRQMRVPGRQDSTPWGSVL
jgi:hypothetical protein